jgi:hypothetical protein
MEDIGFLRKALSWAEMEVSRLISDIIKCKNKRELPYRLLSILKNDILTTSSGSDMSLT